MKWWNKLSDIGLNDQEDIQHVRHVHILNRVFFLTFIFILAYIPINIFLDDYFTVIVLSFYLSLHVLSFYLNHKKKFRLSGYYTFIMIISLLSFSIIAHNDIGVEFLMIPSSLGAFVIFRNKIDSLIILAFFILACAMSQVLKYYIVPVVEFSDAPRMLLYHTNIFTSFIISGAIIINFKTVIESYEDRLLTQKKAIESHNKEITDSINYARSIQLAKLPEKERIYASLKSCFIFYKPKDIVSGDFYYFHQHDHSILLAAADCTGHGVPGALMSMIASEKLNEAVHQSSEPSEILNLTNKGIKTSLRQSENEGSSRDGMDIALCSIDPLNNILKYAGANRPIWIIRKGSTVVEEIKATKIAIGGITEGNQHFDTHTIKMYEGDSFYLCTDGFADQFGRQNKKLTTKKFKQVLLEIQNLTMKAQETYLSDFITNWKANTEQIDDILVIGVRIT